MFIELSQYLDAQSLRCTRTFEGRDQGPASVGLGSDRPEGVSTLLVVDGGRRVPVAAIAGLHLYVNNNRLESLPDEIGALDNRLTAPLEGFGACRS